MSNAPVTEKRLIELLQPFVTEKRLIEIIQPLVNEIVLIKTDITSIKTEIISMKKDITLLNKKMDDVQGFQKHEASAIEFELDMLIKSHVEKKSGNKSLVDFPLKKLYNPRVKNDEITEFDVAFLINPPELLPPPNMSRLIAAKQGIDISLLQKPNKYIKANDSMLRGFVLAEAKHYIYKEKVQKKLVQFEKLLNFFRLAKEYKYLETTKGDIKSLGVTMQFINTINTNKILSNIDLNNCYLYFGAGYWEPKLLHTLSRDLRERHTLIKSFDKVDKNKKKDIYTQIIQIDSNWHNVKSLSDEEIMNLTTVYSPLQYVHLAIPSGMRFKIEKSDDDILGYGSSLKGGSRAKTHKIRPGNYYEYDTYIL
jgi:hypothetical protein